MPLPYGTTLTMCRARAQNAALRLVSPEVHPDRTIIFRLLAPGASQVSLLFGVTDPKPLAMKKDDQGIWKVTIGPVEPEIYTYVYLLNGTRILDRANPVLKKGRILDASVVEVPSKPPRFDQVQKVAHGTLHVRTYQSTTLHRLRKFYIYAPPQYVTKPNQKFPILYLRHGSGDNEANWSEDGRARGAVS